MSLAVPPKDAGSGGTDPDIPNFNNRFILEPKNETLKSIIELPQYGNDDWERNTTGNHKILVIPVMFSDVKNSTTVDDLKGIIANLSDYYYNVSYGKLNLTYDVKDWVTLNKPMSYYGADGGFANESYLRVDALNTVYNQIAFDTINATDSYIYFSQYDHLIIIHAGEDQASDRECTGCLWSMMLPYVGARTDENCVLYSNGLFCNMVDYAILLSETDPFGVYAHEFGHELGLPDLYDTHNGSSVVGVYDMMDAGSWINGNFGAWTRLKLKFANEIIIYNETINLTIEPALKNDTVVKIIRGNPGSWQYYLIELRTKEGYDALIPYEGVLVGKIDESWSDNQISKHTPIADFFLFSESGVFSDNESGVLINITLNPENATLSISSVPADLNISNRIVLVEGVSEPRTCKTLDIYDPNNPDTAWPPGNPQYIVIPENETDYFTINDPVVNYWAKVNANIGDNVTFEFINNSNSYKNITWVITKNMSHNNYPPKLFQWYVDSLNASFVINSSLAGNWSVNLSVNGVFYYSNKFIITDKMDLKPPAVEFTLPEKEIYGSFPVQWNAQDTGENASGLKNYRVNYYDTNPAFTGGNAMEYTTNKTSAVFYGIRGHTYCFNVAAFDRAGNSNVSETLCTLIEPCVNLTNLTGNIYLNSDTLLCKGFYDNVSIILNSSNILLDCDSASLNGTGAGYGIHIENKNNVTIKNCNVMHYKYGIYSEYSEGSQITDNNISINIVSGIRLEYSGNSRIINNSLSLNTVRGIFLYNSSGNTFENNTVNNNGNIGIYVLDNSNFNNISGNKVSGNNDAGILIEVMCFQGPFSGCSENTNNTLYGNEISNNGVGIQSENSNSIINSNYVCWNGITDFGSSGWYESSGSSNTCDKPGDWNDYGKEGCGFYCYYHPCDLNHDGIYISDRNDLMRAYKCFLGLEKSCTGVDEQDWSSMKREYQCFLNSV